MKLSVKHFLLLCTLTIASFGFVGCETGAAGNEEKVVEAKESEQVKEDTSDVKITGKYYFPDESSEHEGTWLQWPHDYTYPGIAEGYEPIWIEMTRGLIKGENVHIIVYDEKEKKRVINVLQEEGISLEKIDFYVYPYEDVWVRDNGPIFAYDEENNLVIQDWKFNGWGNKMPYEESDKIPSLISSEIGITKIDIDMVMEGGALELDGNGTCISTLSCVNNDDRTSEFTLEQIEKYLSKYYGVTNFIWLDGIAGADITDNHIDGIMKFIDEKTIIATSMDNTRDAVVTENPDDAEVLLNAKNADGEAYDFVFLPPTLKDTRMYLPSGEDTWVKGSYINFYVGNKVVLVPNYADENDKVANKIIQDLYPDREVIGIDIRKLFANGGMIHCVTQQQPVSKIK